MTSLLILAVVNCHVNIFNVSHNTEGKVLRSLIVFQHLSVCLLSDYLKLLLFTKCSLLTAGIVTCLPEQHCCFQISKKSPVNFPKNRPLPI